VFYPLFLELQDRRVLVVGGGLVAERKVEGLVEAGAAVTLVAPQVTQTLQHLADKGSICVQQRRFEGNDLEGMSLVISATDDPATQEQVAHLARERGVLLNTVDQPSLCDFILPAIVRKDDVVVAISTSGKSPALAAEMRRRAETLVTENVVRAVRVLGEVRAEVQNQFSSFEERKRVFERIVESGILEWIGECDDIAALKRVREIIGKTE